MSDRVGEWILDGPSDSSPDVLLVRHAAFADVRGEVRRLPLPEDRERLLVAVRALLPLRHPAVLPVLDWWEDAGVPGQVDPSVYVVSAVPEGETLAARVAKAPLNPLDAASTFAEIATALATLADRGVSGFGLRPDAVFLVDGQPRVLAATLLSYAHLDGGPQSDVYTLGLLLYEAITGQDPGESPADGLDVGEGHPLRDLVAAATRHAPDARPDNARAVTDALTRTALALAPPRVAEVQADPPEAPSNRPPEPRPPESAPEPEPPTTRWDRAPLLVIAGGVLVAFWLASRLFPTAPEPTAAVPPAAVPPRPAGMPRSAAYVFPRSWWSRVSQRTLDMNPAPAEWKAAIEQGPPPDPTAEVPGSDIAGPEVAGAGVGAVEVTGAGAVTGASVAMPVEVPSELLEAPPDEPFAGVVDLRRPIPTRMEGIWDDSVVTVGVPDYWELVAPPELHLDILSSKSLLPEVSTVGVWADNAPVASVWLADTDGAHDFILPDTPTPGFHTLRLAAYQRSRVPCELSEHPGLWSEITEASSLRLRYRRVAPPLDLSKWPKPFVDLRDPDPFQTVIVLPPSPTDGELRALGLVAAALGRGADWHPQDLAVHLGTVADLPPSGANVIVLASEPARLPGLLDTFSASGDPVAAEVGRSAATEFPATGLFALLPRPQDPSYTTLAMVGRDDVGLVALAHLLGDRTTDQLATGTAARVEGVGLPGPAAPRAWTGTVPEDDTFTLQDLGLSDQTARGFRGGDVVIPLRMVPDERPDPGTARVDLAYSYAAQADPDLSRLHVLLNDEPVYSEPLAALDGAGRARLSLELPVLNMGPDSRLVVQFDLRGRGDATCVGAAHDPLWGTVHADTRITLPRSRSGPPDGLDLLRFGGFPFGIRPDYADLRFVLPAAPDEAELVTFATLAAELGRVGRGDRLAFGVARNDPGTGNRIVVDRAAEPTPGVHFVLDPPSWSKDDWALHVTVPADGDLAPLLGCEGRPRLFDRLYGQDVRMASCETLAVTEGRAVQRSGATPFGQNYTTTLQKYYWAVLVAVVGGLGALLLVRHQLRQWRRMRAALGQTEES